MSDSMRDDWAMVVSLAEGLSDKPRAAKNAGDRLWAGIEGLRARVAELETERDTVMTTLGVVDEGNRVVAAASFVRQACDAFAARVADLEAIERRARARVDRAEDTDEAETLTWILTGRVDQ